MPGLKLWLCFQFQFPVDAHQGGSRWVAQQLGPCKSHGKSGLSSGFLASAWPRTSYCEAADGRFSHMSLSFLTSDSGFETKKTNKLVNFTEKRQLWGKNKSTKHDPHSFWLLPWDMLNILRVKIFVSKQSMVNIPYICGLHVLCQNLYCWCLITSVTTAHLGWSQHSAHYFKFIPFIWEAERQRETEKSVLSTGVLPKCPQQPRLGQTETGNSIPWGW